MTPPRRDQFDLEEFFRIAFRAVDIEFRSVEFHRWRVVDDTQTVRTIRSLDDLVNEFRDGPYHIGLEGVEISRLNGAKVEMESLDIELEVQDGTWTILAVYPGGEESFEGDIEGTTESWIATMNDRAAAVLTRVKPVLELLRALRSLKDFLS